MLKDRFHNEIVPGCVIAYPGREGNSCWITTGTVTEVLDGPPPASWPSWRQWVPKLRVDGGSRGPGAKQLGRRTIAHSCNIIVIVKARE